jgi:hypothetical protein
MRCSIRILVAAVALCVAGGAYAAKQDFTLVNNTGYEIDSVYVSKSSSDSWEEDVMGRNTLDDGDEVDIAFDKGARGCRFDLMVNYHDGEKAIWANLDLCSISKIQLFWDRKAGTTRAVTE